MCCARLLGIAAWLSAWLVAGCQGDGQQGNKAPPAASAQATSTAGEVSAAPAASSSAPSAAPKNAAAEFFSGASPDSVKLIKGYIAAEENFHYAVKTPAGWTGAGQPGGGYMAMRKDSTAALFCSIMGNDESLSLGALVGFKEIKALAKRAPVMGKDLKSDGSPVVAKVGKRGYSARVGHATGKLFGADGGDLFWIDVRHQQQEGPWHMYCIMAVKETAGNEVVTEAKAVMRSLEPPSGKRVLEPKMD